MNILKEIQSFFGRIFSKTKRLEAGNKEIDNNEKRNSKKKFMNTLKEDTKKQASKEQILEAVEKNPELLYTLSYKRLTQLNEIYEEKIKELKEKIKSNS